MKCPLSIPIAGQNIPVQVCGVGTKDPKPNTPPEKHTKINSLGLWCPTYRVIFLRSDVVEDERLLKSVLLHEAAHAALSLSGILEMVDLPEKQEEALVSVMEGIYSPIVEYLLDNS